MAQNPTAIEDPNNEVLREADEYLRKHKILELFEVSPCSPPYLLGFNYNYCLQAA
jgi:hypothetical protein